MITGSPVFNLQVTELEFQQEGFKRRRRLRHRGFETIEVSVQYGAQSQAGRTLSVAECRQSRRATMQ
jgi:hypothetical protein